MTTFKIGDRVMVTNERDPETGRMHAYSGQAGEVVELDPNGDVIVRFDNAQTGWLFPVPAELLMPDVTATQPRWMNRLPPAEVTADDDPRCVCGVHRSEHALCGCEQFERERNLGNYPRCPHCNQPVIDGGIEHEECRINHREMWGRSGRP